MEQRKSSNNDQMGTPVHSQVRKIKQEYENIKDPYPQKLEIRPVLREITRQLSRSPLGRVGRAISVGDS
ncbi:PREDICTED: uncharacterized protein LOC104607400 [Nelumbo nucifera]|uniref:Uncharacterized protein n=2 Tax=Nelumbo nucifera TaxID=4432 RepID=A0A822YDH9_NELNU|nr:PREDICTED: uncharacterized protein LOC104607400 [Nelumbo nucifera]DAD32204.1 TPA_asm: hypothetical protein HUJ06_011055 [Nelumbo nucifera]